MNNIIQLLEKNMAPGWAIILFVVAAIFFTISFSKLGEIAKENTDWTLSKAKLIVPPLRRHLAKIGCILVFLSALLLSAISAQPVVAFSIFAISLAGSVVLVFPFLNELFRSVRTLMLFADDHARQIMSIADELHNLTEKRLKESESKIKFLEEIVETVINQHRIDTTEVGARFTRYRMRFEAERLMTDMPQVVGLESAGDRGQAQLADK